MSTTKFCYHIKNLRPITKKPFYFTKYLAVVCIFTFKFSKSILREMEFFFFFKQAEWGMKQFFVHSFYIGPQLKVHQKTEQINLQETLKMFISLHCFFKVSNPNFKSHYVQKKIVHNAKSTRCKNIAAWQITEGKCKSHAAILVHYLGKS